MKLFENYCLMLFPLLVLSFTSVLSFEESYSRNDFPSEFVFGSGTSAYQVEGAANEDGRTPSIWDVFAQAGHTGGTTGDVACDQYHKYKEDVKLMVDIGLEAYRFSISWSRLLPSGRGPVNPKGLQYYNNLIDELITHGIQPHVTLHHFDLPQALQDEYGGWLSEKSVRDFTDYANTCFKEFGDRVRFWTTINEANVFSLGGYDQGITPPGRCSPPFGLINCTIGNSSIEPYIAVHNMLLAHASATNLYKKQYKYKQHGEVGISVYTYGTFPLTNSEEDKQATDRLNDFLIGWILHPLVFGDYPETMRTIVGSRLPVFTADESEQVKGAFDFFGVINYMAVYVKDNSSSQTQNLHDFTADMAVITTLVGNTSAKYEHANIPWSIQQVLLYIKETYENPPIYIAENGQTTLSSSSLEDTSRVKYLSSHIEAVLHSLRKGSNVKGYFQWSLMDLFELFSGYKTSYGLYYVDFKDPDLRRYPKLSAHWSIAKESTSEITKCITTHHRKSEDGKTSFSFVNCTIYGTWEVWRTNMRTICDCCLLVHTNVWNHSPDGWNDFDNRTRDKAVYFGEYGCFGERVKTKGKVAYAKQLRDSEASAFTTTSYVDGDKWLND